jgi:hypothetical protein
VMCRVMMLDVERVRRRDARLDQLTLGQRQRCGRDTKLRDRGGLNSGGRPTLGVRVSREGVAVAVAVEAVVAAAVVAVGDVRVGEFALDLKILLRLNYCGNAFD